MKYRGKIAFCIAVGMGLQLSAHALTMDPNNPYKPIVDRNVFSLKAAPTAAPQTEVVTSTPPPKVTLLGIVSSLGKKEVIFKALAANKPGEAPKEATFNLGVKEMQADFEVEDIDHKAGTVRLKNHNVEQFLSLEKDGMKPTGGGGAPGAPGVAQAPGGPAAVPGNNPSPFGGANMQRPIRPPTTPTATNGAGAQTAEEQAAVLEVQRALTKEKVDRGQAPPLPPAAGDFNRPPAQAIPRLPGQ